LSEYDPTAPNMHFRPYSSIRSVSA
jgi:peptidoglycan-N-acetylglucosamine deacetylase